MKIVLEEHDLEMAVAHYVRDVLGCKFESPVVEFPDSDFNPEWSRTAVVMDASEDE